MPAADKCSDAGGRHRTKADAVNCCAEEANHKRLRIIRPGENAWIVDWDFNPDIPLSPGVSHSPTLGAFLLRLVEERQDLTIRVLVWAMRPIYSGKSLTMLRKQRWSCHPRIVLAFDSRHPIHASHHRKPVVVDDTVAFVGGDGWSF